MADAPNESVPFLGLASDHAVVRDDAMARIERVLDSQRFVLGPEAEALEASLADSTGCENAIACASGSDALLLALMALGVGAGDAVVVPAFTFFATAGAVVMAGATPSFIDVDAATLNLGPSELEKAIGTTLELRDGRLMDRRSRSPIKAILPVHLYGLPADIAGLRRFLQDLPGLEDPPVIVEDAAQALCATGDAGRVGSLGEVGCFSFYPTKNLGGAGDGGMLTTNDGALAQRLRALRTHGAAAGGYLHSSVGMNARLGEIEAAYLNAKLPYLSEWTQRRRAIAASYRRLLAGVCDAGLVTLPPEAQGQVYHQFTVRPGADRDGVATSMLKAGVETRVFYPIPLHLQPCFVDLGYEAGSLPHSEKAAERVLCLPIYPSLSDSQVETVSSVLCAALEENA